MSAKTRASCDACHFAKVKCSKGLGSCQRCYATGINCIYSPPVPRTSYKTHRKVASESTTGDPHPARRSRGNGPLDARDASYSSLGHIVPFPSEEEFLNMNELTRASSTSSSTWEGSGPLDPVPDSQRQRFPQSSTFMALPSPAQGGTERYDVQGGTERYDVQGGMERYDVQGFDLSVPGHHHSLGNFNMAFLSPPDTVMSSITSTALSEQQSPNTTMIPPDIAMLANEQPSPATPASSMPDTSDICNCFSLLLEVMHRLHKTASAKKPPLDDVLACNRIAASQCFEALECPIRGDDRDSSTNSSSSSCVILACGLLERMLVTYRRAIEEFCRDLEEHLTDQRIHPSPHSGAGPQAKQPAKHHHHPSPTKGLELRFGTFSMDEGEQVPYLKSIVTKEIKKLRSVAQKANRDSDDATDRLLNHLVEVSGEVIELIRE